MKKSNILRVLPLAAILILSFIALSGCGKAPDPVPDPKIVVPDHAPTTEIVILHTNDAHGRITGNDTDIIGIDRIAAIRKSIPGSILLDAGDALHGLPIATLSRGADIVRLMNAA